ncbi:MAG: hypothetical protein ACKVUT_09325 [Gaiella sp.]
MSAVEETTERTTFRGATLEEILPRIREELGPQAVVVRRREGVVGGIGGFFGKRCVEVEVEVPTRTGLPFEEPPVRAVPARHALGAYVNATPVQLEELGTSEDNDAEPIGEDTLPDEPGFGSSPHSPFEDLLRRQVFPFVEQETLIESEPARSVRASRPPALPAAEPEELVVMRDLAEAGIASDVAATLLCVSLTHYRALAPAVPLRDHVRQALAAALGARPGWSTPRRVVALVGLPGTETAILGGALCAAYAGAGLSVGAATLGDIRSVAALAAATEDVSVRLGVAEKPEDVRERLEWREDVELMVAIAPLVTAEDRAALDRAAAFLRALAPSETHLVVPGGARAHAIDAAVTALGSRVRVAGIVPSGLCADDRIGGFVSAAIKHRLAVPWVVEGSREPAVLPADAWALAERCLPRHGGRS